jgi:hypothetical protein
MYWAIFAGGLLLGVLLRGWVKAPEAPPLPVAKSAAAKRK